MMPAAFTLNNTVHVSVMANRSRMLLKAVCTLLAAIFTAVTSATDQPYQSFGDHNVHYSVFNSSFLEPEIARLYNITRGGDWALVNIAITRKDPLSDVGAGVTAKVTGTATNLMQQQRTLPFFEIREKNAVYYLAPLRFTNEEVLNLSIDVLVNGARSPYTLKFTKTLYVEG